VPRAAHKGWVGAIQIPKFIIIFFNLNVLFNVPEYVEEKENF
jgi:hypothetical protein